MRHPTLKSPRPTRQVIGDRLRAARRSSGTRGVTLRRLEEMTGISKSALQGYETGRRMPSAIVLLRIAVVLDIDLNDLARSTILNSSEHTLTC